MRVDGISKTKYKQVEYCMRPPFTLVWKLGYDTGLRVSDILKLTPKKNKQAKTIHQRTENRKTPEAIYKKRNAKSY